MDFLPAIGVAAVGAASDRFVLRDLSLSSRLVITFFLVSVGFGYLSALVQLHFNGGAKPGEALPDKDAAVNTYHGPVGPQPMSHIERLLEAPETEAFNGSGTMRPAFTTKSSGWGRTLRPIDELEKTDAPKAQEQRKKLLAEREGERLAMLAWVKGGGDVKTYGDDDFPLPADLQSQPVTAEFLVKENDEPVSPPRVMIKALIDTRCVDCHGKEASKGRAGNARKYPLENHAELHKYLEVKTATAMDMGKLAQTTHVHLLGFSMLYGLTGLIFTFTTYPGWARAIVGPWALAWQLVDISFWWLGRFDSLYAGLIPVTGALVAVGLMTQIMGTTFDLYDRKGKLVLVVLVLAVAGAGAAVERKLVAPYLEAEKARAAATSPGL
jgi:mono/diheme cytochrome c family protein